MSNIRLKIDKILKEKNKTIYWLSQESGISYNNLAKIVRNDTNSIRFDTLTDIIETLHIEDINDLIEYISD